MTYAPALYMNNQAVPANYRVEKVAFADYTAYAPCGRMLDQHFTCRAYAVNACVRHERGLDY